MVQIPFDINFKYKNEIFKKILYRKAHFCPLSNYHKIATNPINIYLNLNISRYFIINIITMSHSFKYYER